MKVSFNISVLEKPGTQTMPLANTTKSPTDIQMVTVQEVIPQINLNTYNDDHYMQILFNSFHLNGYTLDVMNQLKKQTAQCCKKVLLRFYWKALIRLLKR